MKITNGVTSVGTGPDTSRTKSATQSARSQAAPASDQVALSALAARLQDTGAEPMDTARIAEIKQAIAEGRFQINPERIADGLLESARQLLAKGG